MITVTVVRFSILAYAVVAKMDLGDILTWKKKKSKHMKSIMATTFFFFFFFDTIATYLACSTVTK